MDGVSVPDALGYDALLWNRGIVCSYGGLCFMIWNCCVRHSEMRTDRRRSRKGEMLCLCDPQVIHLTNSFTLT